MFELLNPDFMRQLLESFETMANALQNIARAGFDDASRLRVRAEYLDDGYVRVRDTSATVDILEMLREFSWTFYNLAESNKLLSDLAGALSSVGTDKLRVSPVDALPESPFNLSKIGGTALTGRDWSGDLAKLQNLDVLLSSRASESTLSAIKAQTDKLTFDASNRLAIQNPPNLDVALSTRASEATLKTLRWGRDVSPAWIHGDEITAPAANTALVSKTVSTGKSGYVYGFFISAGEANDFKINWTSGGASRSIRIPFASKGAVQYVDFVALNEGMSADAGSSITITNVNAGSSGIVYQARILYVEV
jgi:hypothetical protein